MCKKLIEDNEIICMDNFITGSGQNLIDLMDYGNFTFIMQDVMNPIVMEVDYIYNLACPASPVHYQYNPVKTIKTNVLGTINTLECASVNQATVLLSSTSEVYGDPKQHPQNESYWGNVNPIGIRSCYDEGKRAAECIMMDYYRQWKAKIKIARIFNTYGTNMSLNDGRVVSNFIIQSLQNKDITIYGDGSQTRSFCYVDDMVEGLVKLMDTNSDVTGPINLGHTEEHSILNLAELIIKLCNSRSQIKFFPLPEDDPVRRSPDISLAKEKLQWSPETSLEKGIENTISYFDRII